MEIIRNCAHFGSVQVALELDADGQPFKVVKTAFDRRGAQAILREYQGLCWYKKRSPGTASRVFALQQHNDTFCRMEFTYQAGSTGILGHPMAEVRSKIFNALEHHRDVFHKGGGRYSHGDYSIDNILFKGDQVIGVLDWENFNDRLPPGFDMVYCVMEAGYFCYRKKGRLDPVDVDTALELIRHGLGRIGAMQARILQRPARYIRQTLLEYKDVFGAQLMKYPFMACQDADIEILDRFFMSRATR